MKSDETERLLARTIEGDATADEQAQLAELLRGDEGAKEHARKQLEIDAHLSIVMEGDFSSEKHMREIMNNVESADSEQFAMGVESRLNRRRWTERLGAIAAVLLLSCFGIFYFSASNIEPLAMATVSRAENVVWSEGALSRGQALESGSSLRIENGLLELDLDGRGRLIVEGPASMDFPEAGRAVLHHGRIVMRATVKGHGYSIETPQGNIIDLGTEFGVSVADNGMVETHVIDGSVEAVSNTGKRVTLMRNDALRMGEGGDKEITADLGQFYTSMPPQQDAPLNFIHWGFDDAKGNLSRASGGLSTDPDVMTDMIFHAMEDGTGPRWTEGPQGAAIKLDGLGSYAESGYRGIEGAQPRTVCFWINVPQDFSPRQGFGIVSWGELRNLKGVGTAWQISANPLESDGPIGRLRLGLGGGQILGSTDLRDGLWHHVAVVMYGGSQPNVGTHILLYVDGEQEQVSRRALQEVRTEVDRAKHGVWVGRNVSYRTSDPQHVHGGFFRGGVDELYIFDSALNQKDIKELMGTVESEE